MDILTLGYIQVKREGKSNNKNVWDLILDRAIQIRHYLDIQNRNKKIALNRYEKSNF